ncbi:MAG: class I SAM-dependent methyltransferase [Candidatus Aminicenantes bacterium]|nr:class I SAM-dependent methyltransferase [Candidatus Aminicenantes bacterium]
METSFPSGSLQYIKIKLSGLRLSLFGSQRNFRRAEECKIILRWLNPQPGEKILDVGCGEGYLSEKIASCGALVKAIDLNPKAIASARNRVKNERLEFRELDAAELDYPEAFFDKIVSFCVIEHFVDDEKVLFQLARMLKPGGRLVFSADSLSNPGITDNERERHRRRYAVKSFYTKEKIVEKLQKVGLKTERCRYVLTSRLAVAMSRFSWKLDDLPPALAPVRLAGYAVLGTAGLLLLRLAERRAAESKHGLTLLVEASKP